MWQMFVPMKPNLFFHPGFLKRVHPGLLREFFESFASSFRGLPRGLPLPDLPDEDYLRALLHFLRQPEALPLALSEALAIIAGMAHPQAQSELEAAFDEAKLPAASQGEWSREDLAFRVWLAAPALLAQRHNRRRLQRLTAWISFGAGAAGGERVAFREPAPAALTQLQAALDQWFGAHQRGHRTTRVELERLDGQLWFLIRHGGLVNRAARVEEQRTEVFCYRPERDDVVVYCPQTDCLRMNARARSERELYRRQFGLLLHGSETRFSEHDAYTLEPLRTEGRAALDAAGIEGLARITLREVAVARGNGRHEVNTIEADDVFLCGDGKCDGMIPVAGTVVRAAFEFRFDGCPRAQVVQIRVPNTLKLSRHCHPGLVQRWLCRSHFLIEHGRAARA